MTEPQEQANTLKKAREPYTATLLDVESLDQTLFRLLESFLLSLFRDAPSSANRYAKLLALPFIRLISIVATNGQTPATKILKLELISGTKDISSYSTRVILFGLLSAFLPSIRDPCFEWIKTQIQSRIEDHQQEVSDLTRIAQRRQRIVFSFIQKFVTRMFPVARLCCLLACWAGITKTASLSMLALGLGFQPIDQQKPRLHVNYAHRRWLQQEATSTAKVFLGGLWMISSWKPIMDAFLSKPLARFAARISPPQAVDPTTCPICQNDIKVPLLLSCGHTACYTCFYADLDHVNKASCRICSKRTHESHAVLAAHC